MAEKQDQPRKWTFDDTEPDLSNLPEPETVEKER